MKTTETKGQGMTVDYTETQNVFEDSQRVVVTTEAYAVEHVSYRRGGCLYAGVASLLNLETFKVHHVDLTSRASDSDAHVRYLLSLAERHTGPRYEVKCDDCRQTIGRTDSVREAAAGGRCASCRAA